MTRDEEWDEDDWEEDDELEGDASRPLAPAGSLALGFAALLPLFASYEAARVAVGGGLRNTSELLVGRIFVFAGEHEAAARIGVLAVATMACFVFARRAGWRITRSLLRIAVEGLVAAVLLGPLLLLFVRVLGDRVSEVVLPSGLPPDVPDLARTALLFGSAAWEELCFRLGVYSIAFVLVARAMHLFGASRGLASVAGDGAAIVLSSLVFAAVHLDVVVGSLGAGGEPFHSGLFAWRLFAGLCLAVLYRWRGLGVAGWCHGLFNVGLILGAGPAVFV